MRPAATSSRTCSALRWPSRSATRSISGVIKPSLAFSSCVTAVSIGLGSGLKSQAVLSEGCGMPGVSGEENERGPPICAALAKLPGFVPFAAFRAAVLVTMGKSQKVVCVVIGDTTLLSGLRAGMSLGSPSLERPRSAVAPLPFAGANRIRFHGCFSAASEIDVAAAPRANYENCRETGRGMQARTVLVVNICLSRIRYKLEPYKLEDMPMYHPMLYLALISLSG